MVRIVVFSACTLLVVTQASFACNYLSDRSVVFADNTMPICEDIFDSVGVLSVDTLNWYEAEERPLDEPQKTTGMSGRLSRKTRHC